MSGRDISLDYANSVIYDLQKAFWDERGRGARFRVTTVGRDYFLDNCLPLLEGCDLEGAVGTIEEVLEEEGLVEGVSVEVDGRLLRVEVKGCLHQDVEQRLIEKGIEPFTCLPANLMALAIEECLDQPVELAQIKVEDGVCNLMLVVFESRPTFD
jgi:hypothetical protein